MPPPYWTPQGRSSTARCACSVLRGLVRAPCASSECMTCLSGCCFVAVGAGCRGGRPGRCGHGARLRLGAPADCRVIGALLSVYTVVFSPSLILVCMNTALRSPSPSDRRSFVLLSAALFCPVHHPRRCSVHNIGCYYQCGAAGSFVTAPPPSMLTWHAGDCWLAF